VLDQTHVQLNSHTLRVDCTHVSTSSLVEPGDHFERRAHRAQAPPSFGLELFDVEVPTFAFETTSLALRVVGLRGFEYDVPCRSA
jgi:hypothetical protein